MSGWKRMTGRNSNSRFVPRTAHQGPQGSALVVSPAKGKGAWEGTSGPTAGGGTLAHTQLDSLRERFVWPFSDLPSSKAARDWLVKRGQRPRSLNVPFSAAHS